MNRRKLYASLKKTREQRLFLYNVKNILEQMNEDNSFLESAFHRIREEGICTMEACRVYRCWYYHLIDTERISSIPEEEAADAFASLICIIRLIKKDLCHSDWSESNFFSSEFPNLVRNRIQLSKLFQCYLDFPYWKEFKVSRKIEELNKDFE